MIRRGLVVGVSLSILVGVGTAHATVTVGSPLTATFTPKGFTGVGTSMQTELPEAGAVVASPVNGVIVKWRILDGSGGPFKLRVVTPDPGGTYTGAGTSAPETPTSLGVQTFSTDLPIKAGDLIGIDNSSNTDTLGLATLAGSEGSAFIPSLPDGTTEPPVGSGMGEIALNADVVPAPGISAVSPSSGSIAGGTTVTITGHDFTGASAVSFGSAKATSFTANSDTQITAVAPAASAPGTVDVRVTTAAGQSTVVAGDEFTYTSAKCTVPKVTGKKLKAAKHKIKAAGCTVGKVQGHGSKVRKQHPKAGSVLAAGAKVSLKLGF